MARESHLGDVCIVDAASDPPKTTRGIWRSSLVRWVWKDTQAHAYLPRALNSQFLPSSQAFTISSPRAFPRVAASETNNLDGTARTLEGRDGGEVWQRRLLGMIREAGIPEKAGSWRGCERNEISYGAGERRAARGHGMRERRGECRCTCRLYI
jgi:hypothetical protein